MNKLIIALLCLIAADCYSFDFPRYAFGSKSDTSDYTNFLCKGIMMNILLLVLP